jgi:hypothetical protein
MFELFSGDPDRTHRRSIPVLLSTSAHIIVIGVLTAISIIYVSAQLPEVPDMLAFTVSAPTPPAPPPPPPAALPASTQVKPKPMKPVPTASPRAAPVEAPREIVAELHVDSGIPEGAPVELKEEFRAAWLKAL